MHRNININHISILNYTFQLFSDKMRDILFTMIIQFLFSVKSYKTNTAVPGVLTIEATAEYTCRKYNNSKNNNNNKKRKQRAKFITPCVLKTYKERIRKIEHSFFLIFLVSILLVYMYISSFLFLKLLRYSNDSIPQKL